MWLTIILLSALVGAASGWLLAGPRAIVVGAGVPWLALLGWLLYHEYVVPYEGGGASMWPVALLVAGTVAALVGALTAAAVRAIKRKNARPGP